MKWFEEVDEGTAIDIASAVATIANGLIPEHWAKVAAVQEGDLGAEDLANLTRGLDAFIGCFLILSPRLKDAGFIFVLPDHILRAATAKDVAALNAFIEKHGSVPPSIQAWYRRMASFNFGQHGSQMFDRTQGFYFMHRFHQFTMPPIATACTSRWDDLIGWEGDDKEAILDDDRVFFALEESGMDEDWKGFGLPDGSVDPNIDSETSMTFLQWAAYQTKWGGFGYLPQAMEEAQAVDVSPKALTKVFQM